MSALRYLVLAAAVAAAAPAAAQVKRVGPPNSPISQAAVVPAGTDIVYVSGITPAVVKPGANGAPADFGDTRTQTISVLNRIGEILKAEGLDHGDVFMMRVLLVGDPAKGGNMDFAGMMEGYRQFYGTPTQPNKPARITSQVVALASPGMLAEIEVQAARRK